MLQARSCDICGRIFQPNGFLDICPNCFEKDQKDYDRVREYIYAHPCAKVFEVVTNLEISVNRIKRYLKEGRLEIVEKTSTFLTCESCGKPLQSGRYCDECAKKSQSAHNFKVLYNENTSPNKDTKINYRPSKNNTKTSNKFAVR